MANIFLSYSRADKARVAPLVGALEAQGWSVWWDPAIIPGQEFDDRIAEEIDKASAVVVVWTPLSVASRWVRGEAREAADRGILVPVRFEKARLPIDVRAVHTTDLDDWREDASSQPFQDLLSALRLLLKDVPRAAPAAEHRASICVLPFANMSDDREQEYFSDGISEDIITDLSKVSALAVIARNTAFTFKGRSVDVPQVARQLKVSHVLEGSVRRSGNRVRITAQLIDGTSGNHVWAERYDRDLEDIFALQDEISEAIVSALRLKLLPEEKKAIEDRGTDNVEAYDTFLRARALSTQLGAAPLRRAAELLRHALKLDPNFLLAAVALRVALRFYSIYAPARRVEASEEIEALTRRVTALAPEHWCALMLRAYLLSERRDFLGAEPVIEKARRSFPGPVLPDELMHLRARFSDTVGRYSEAIEVNRERIRLDPLSFGPSHVLQAHLHIMGREDEEEAEYARSRDLTGNRGVVEALALFRMWNRAERQAILAQYRRYVAARLSGFDLPASAFDELEAVLFDPPAARARLWQAFDDPGFQNPTSIALLVTWGCLYSDTDLALAAMRKTHVDMSFIPTWPMWYPEAAEARKEPRFKQIVRDLGLYDYWRMSGKWGEFARPKGDEDFEIIK